MYRLLWIAGVTVCAMTVVSVADAADSVSLQIESKIPLGGIHGRIDHLAIDLNHHRLYVAELANNTVGVVDVKNMKVVGRLTGLRQPQGIGYVPSSDTVYVASAGDGLINEEVGPLWEDWMHQVYEMLADEELVQIVHDALVQRWPLSRTRGRRGTPAEVVLRMVLLKHIRNWSPARPLHRWFEVLAGANQEPPCGSPMNRYPAPFKLALTLAISAASKFEIVRVS